MTAAPPPPPAQPRQPGAYPPHPEGQEDSRPARPWTVVVGAILGWVASALLLIAGVGQLVSVANTDPASLMGAMNEAVALTATVIIVAGLLGGLLTTLAFRGSRGALVALTVLAVLSALVPIAALLYLLTSVETGLALPWRALVGALWAAAVIALFWSGQSWFRALRRS
ncbi:hypothetical protein [Ruania zhangjianzhongii]|uniref:hypothetical protein n=1 Tax=Ruania zhangjianzhongii TaxID=2603206 RepID=UPI0011C9B327|nr:hypothetical protein [Ruania zhangjianzhongii]